MTAKTLSVVIPTRNEEQNIRTCILGCLNQSLLPKEIIVVDNTSTDKTAHIAQDLGARVLNFGPERSAQRNFGLLQCATGDAAIFLDADMTPTETLFESCLRHLVSPVVALYIDEFILGGSAFSRIRRFERSFYSGTVIDGVRCFRRDDFVRIGGFDESLPPGPEDWDLDIRFEKIGKLALLPNSGGTLGDVATHLASQTNSKVPTDFVGVLHNEAYFQFQTYLRKKAYYVPGLSVYKEKWGDCHPRVSKQLSGLYRVVTVFLELGRYKQLIKHPFLTIGMLFLRVSVAITYLRCRRHIQL